MLVGSVFICPRISRINTNFFMDEIVRDSVVPDAPEVAAADGVEAEALDSQEVAAASPSSAPAPAPAPLRGKAAYKARLKEKKPELGDDIGDDDMFDDALASISETQSRYDELMGGNKRLAELVHQDPRLRALLVMISDEKPKSIQYAIGKLYGKEFLEMDDEGLEEFEKGEQERKEKDRITREAYAEADKNIGTYLEELAKFGKANKLSEEAVGVLGRAVESFAVDVLKGNITPSFIEFVWRGMNYEKDVVDAAAAGEAEGRNKRVAPELKKMATVAPVGAATVDSSVNRSAPAVMSMLRGGSHWDNLTEVN